MVSVVDAIVGGGTFCIAASALLFALFGRDGDISCAETVFGVDRSMLFGVDRSVRVDGGVPGVVAGGIPTLHVALLFALFERSSAFAIVLTKITLFVN